MTIGADMPLKSLIGARIKDSGKGESPIDLLLPADGKAALDFETMVKATAPKLHRGKSSEVKEGVRDTPDKDAESKNDEATAPAAGQGMFGQTMLALEQLLQTQQHAQEQSLATADPRFAASIVDEAAALIDGTTSVKPVGKPASEAALPDKAAETSPAAPPVKTEAAQPRNGEATPAATPPSARPQASEANAQPPSTERSVPRLAEPSPAPSTNAAMANASAGGQSDLRIATPLTPAAAAPVAGRPGISDVQVISDRSTSATRTLVIQLQPIELGTVTARLRLTSEGMHIQLNAENNVAAEHLARDHEALGKALKLAGVGDDTSSITIAVIDRSSPTSNAQGGQLNSGGQDAQADARAYGQGQAASGGAKQGGSTGQQYPGDTRADEREEKAGKPGIESHVSRGLVV
ncbi:chemotaxis protein MotD [Phyllobacterium sp. YR620]|uniref:flagellar hook-length control protein FliK n=1 Tax=Phyllobacterium sp. YR620 TaxID=1881066 RepID=UPI0008868121|nr:flagellar hook-length control protein FliK [Phyllobacterium sp. YR620]SDO88883.1 chemotaxis protein MotD [Phyllobacterium sp. YR620]